MAYWIQKVSSNYNMSNYRCFVCDYLSDISKLPKFGVEGKKQNDDIASSLPCSYCLCLEDSSRWILGKSTNEWQKINIESGGDGSSGGSDLDIATEDEVDSMLDDVFS